jgi:hypothetical protein
MSQKWAIIELAEGVVNPFSTFQIDGVASTAEEWKANVQGGDFGPRLTQLGQA